MAREDLHIGRAIRQQLTANEHTVVWLARKLYCSRNNVYRIFEKQHIDAELLLRLCIILQYDFFKLYSDKIKLTYRNKP